ncbi:hypothetical protein M1M30_gp163 [Maribacter phage Colly_1]|uniref:Uncharacterized protein n=1 Tax=Maribacter phage Colly_1 TaxID=2745691 RepID=A0A8E4UXX7_9CAUD|nr:hypothetical protein M1M30_gp163 [Maribacter phage Colly_1]QQO97266.1 hypothetical protein Colly1_163 [Maribacter phage Colly_1]
MANEYYQMMINNAKEHLESAPSHPVNGVYPNAFQISEVLAITTGKLKEEIVIDLIN